MSTVKSHIVHTIKIHMIRAYVDGLECDASFAFLMQPTVPSYDNTGY